MSYLKVMAGVGVVVAGVTLAACSPTTTTQSSPSPVATPAQQQMMEPTGDADAMATKNIVETAAAAGQFNTLLELATKAGLADALATSEVTVFAPTDSAFAKLPPATLAAVQADPKLLADVLKYHVVAGSMTAKDVVASTSLDTLLGQKLMVKVVGETVMINDAKVVTADIMASNGVIHVVDSVIVPAQQ